MRIARIIATAFLSILTGALSGCAAQRTVPAAEKFVDTGENCTVPKELEDEIHAGKLILIGETHGTVEGPSAFARVVCRALQRGYAVSAGLEFSPEQAEPLAVYLASDGGGAAVEQLLRSAFWARKFQDGRSSSAMLMLLERLRALKQRSAGLNVFVLEERHGDMHPASGSRRDENMASRLRTEHRLRPQAVILTLTGNIHNRLTPIDATFDGRAIPIPMGALLRDLSPVSLMLETTGGTAWVCAPECGVKTFAGMGRSSSSFPHYQANTAAQTAQWWLGQSTASLPAVQSEH